MENLKGEEIVFQEQFRNVDYCITFWRGMYRVYSLCGTTETLLNSGADYQNCFDFLQSRIDEEASQ